MYMFRFLPLVLLLPVVKIGETLSADDSSLLISWVCCAMSRVLHNILGVLRNDLGVLENVLSVLCNVLVCCAMSTLHSIECTLSIGFQGCIGGADRTFACKSQECLWQDWYIYENVWSVIILHLNLKCDYYVIGALKI